MSTQISFSEYLTALMYDKALWLFLVVVFVCFYREYFRVQSVEKAFKWLLWDFSGIRFIVSKIYPQDDTTEFNDQSNSTLDNEEVEATPIKRAPSTFMIWTVGLYAALFGITSNRYENSVDKIEARMSAFITQLIDIKPDVRKDAFREIKEIQSTKCPLKPELMMPSSVFLSLIEEDIYDQTVERLTSALDKYRDDLKGAQLSYARLDSANLSGARLEGAFLDYATLEGADLTGAHLDFCQLQNSNFNGADLSGAYLNSANMYGTSFRRTNLSSANFENVLSWNADFENAILFNANFNRAQLYDANFKGANLYTAQLKSAQLYDANLKDADLRSANLEGAFLLGANLEGANLVGARLTGSKLKGAEGLTVNQLCSARNIHQVDISNKIESQVKQQCPKLLEDPSKGNDAEQ